MRIAVWLDSGYVPETGGSFSYTNRLIKEIDRYEFSEGVDICYAVLSSVKVSKMKKDVVVIRTPTGVISRMPNLPPVVVRILRRLSYLLFSRSIRKQLKANNISLIYYTSQFTHYVKGFPFVCSHWDIAHRSTFAFPEFSLKLQNTRDEYYNYFVPRALKVFVESKAGQEELIQYTGLNKDRIGIVPLFAGECTSFSVPDTYHEKVLKEYGLEKNRFFFYPAQFLAEKNHFAVVSALSKVVMLYPNYKLVLTGNNPKSLCGTKDYIKTLVEKLNLVENVIFPGFVPLEYLYVFYKNACAHIMASYVGPTNMPPLEAMELGCPVICSDLAGHKEEMGEAAIYFNPKSINELADAMNTMIKHRDEYVKKINIRAKECPFNVGRALQCIDNNLKDIIAVRSTWS